MAEAESTQDGDALRHAIGALVVAFADLEFTLAHAVVCLIGSEEAVGQSAVAPMPFKMLVDVYCTVLPLRTRDESILSRLRSLRASLAEEEDYRNRMMHSFWMPDVAVEGERGETTNIMGTHLRLKTSSRARKGLQTSVELVDPIDILKHSTRLNELRGELMDLIPTWPPRVARGRRRDSHWD